VLNITTTAGGVHIFPAATKRERMTSQRPTLIRGHATAHEVMFEHSFGLPNLRLY